MRKIRETLCLHHDSGLGQRPISRCLNISRTTVGDYLHRAKIAGLGWPLPESLTDQQLYNRLFPPAGSGLSSDRPLPDCAYLHTELKRKGVTLMLLWEEYQARVSLQPLLRTVPAVGAEAEDLHAADAQGRREAVRRLLRSHQQAFRTTRWLFP